MPKYVVKRLLWLVILAILTISGLRLLSGIGDLILYYQEGADPASALNIVPNVPPDLYVHLDWRSDDADTGRKMEPMTRVDIQSAYLRAWLQWNLSLLKNESYGLDTYFVGPALADIKSQINEVAAKGWLVEQADMTHSLQLHVYAADGSIVSFTDWNAGVVDIIHAKNGAALFVGETKAAYHVVMMLEDGNWRVRHWVRISDEAMNKVVPALQTPPGFVGKDADKHILMLNSHPYYIAGMNYYPVDMAWDRFWIRYNQMTIDHDFQLMRSLGLNAVRIFVPFDQFGGAKLGANPGAEVTPTTAASKPVVVAPLKKLSDLLTRASKHGLHVIVTLFDFRSDYTLLHWPQADRQLEALLTQFKDNPAILAWDLKNEPDQDYKAAGKYLVDAWLTHIAYLARHYDPHHLLTIGWATAQAAHTTIPVIDFVSFHYYAPAAALAGTYASLRKAVPTQPIVMSEVGLPTWNSFLFPNGHSEAEQAAYYAAILHFLRTSKSAGYLAWTLYDFSYVPATVAGNLPWQKEPQAEMGVLHTNGKPKPAARLLAPNANLNVPTVAGWQQHIKPFWITVSTVMLISIGAVAAFVVLRRRRQKNSPPH